MIKTIREKQPAYNLITNNCQTYALQLLDSIKADGFKQFGTTLDVYERLTGEGKVVDLFAKPLEEAKPAPDGDQGSVTLAQQVMNENTTQLDTHEEKKKHDKKKEDNKKERDDKKRGKEDKESKGGLFSRFIHK